MRISRLNLVQVAVFVVVSLLGMAYVGVRYVGIGQGLIDGDYLVHADFTQAGGIFPNAPVTVRGVPVGQVTAVSLHGNGVRVDLRIHGTVPSDLHAVVAQRSAVGEQYLDLRPDTDTAPYLRPGDTIPADRTGVPLPVETLLANLDTLVRSVDVRELTVLVDELGTAFESNGTALRQIIDASDALLKDATTYLPQTKALISDGSTVLATQLAEADAIRRWAAGLATLTQTLKSSDGDLRRLLTNGPPAMQQLIGLLRDLDPSIGTLLGNLITVNGIAARRLPGIEQILVEYPIAVSGGFTVAPGDGTAHFGLVLNTGTPPPCQYANGGMAACHSVRGTNAAPGTHGTGPAPAPATGPTVDPATGLATGSDGLPLQLGGTGGQYQVSGAQSWKQLLLAGLSP